MRAHRLTAVVVTAAFAAGGFTAAAVAAQDATAGRTERVTLVGCVGQVSDGVLELMNATRSSRAPRSNGSSSAKASTPIGHRTPPTERQRTAGANTPKGSTPIGVAPVLLTSPGPNGVYSPKASTPVRRNQTVTYALDAPADLSSHAGRLVEITGSLQTQRVLKVETIRPLEARCTP